MARCGCNNTCSCVLSATNTPCIKTSVTGLGTPILPYNITVTPVISSDTGNSLECRANGLFAQGVVIIGDTDNDNCVNITATQGPVGTYTLEGSLIVSPDIPDPNGGPNAGNGAECLAGTGLLVAPSVDPTNLLKFGPDGRLEVLCEDVQDCIGQEIGPQLAGTCLAYDDAANKINVVICDDPTNTLTCNAAGSTNPNCTNGGLYVPPAPTVVHVIDNDPSQNQTVGPNDTITFTCVPVPITTSVAASAPCISVQGDTCNGFNIQLGIASNDPCNGLECHGDGLFAPQYEPSIVNPQQGVCPGPANPAANQAPTQYGPLQCQTFTNTSDCKSMAVIAMHEVRDFTVTRNAGGYLINAELNFNGGPFSTWGFINNQAGPNGISTVQVGTYSREVATLPPGGSITVCARMSIGTNGFNGNMAGCQIITLSGWPL